MGITSSLQTGLSGLSSSQSQIDVVGNNIANVNTVGFKSSRLDFKTQFLENFSYGTAPSASLGGTNPLQIGLGTQAGAVTRDFGDGSLQVTGVSTNLAVQGSGFFVLKDGTQQVYTRDGSFQLNGLDQLVRSTGQLVQGFGVDNNFNVVPGVLTNVTIPLGSLTVAQATQNATITGEFNTGGTVPTSVADITSQPLFLSDGLGGVDPTNPPTSATLLTNVTDSTGVPQFQSGDVITLTGKRGPNGDVIPAQTLTITSASTLADLQAFMTGSLGISTAAGANGSLATAPGVTTPATGNTAALTIDGNPGSDNDLTLGTNDFTITRAGSPITPFTFTKNSTADGESIKTTMQVEDSLGTKLSVDVTAVLQTKNASGSTWRVFANSNAGTATGVNVQTAIGTGVLSYDTTGQLTSTTSPTFTIDRTNSGTEPTLTVALDFSKTTALSGSASTIGSSHEDGSIPGNLTSFNIGNDGKITGSFSNGLSRTLGQVALASFRNNEGLIDKGSNNFIEGPNSGNAIITAPQQLSTGRLVSGALELSNVDLGEFVQLISASTAFSASSRVITTSNQLLQELLSASR